MWYDFAQFHQDQSNDPDGRKSTTDANGRFSFGTGSGSSFDINRRYDTIFYNDYDKTWIGQMDAGGQHFEFSHQFLENWWQVESSFGVQPIPSTIELPYSQMSPADIVSSFPHSNDLGDRYRVRVVYCVLCEGNNPNLVTH
jgi:hypothetical protein